MKTQWAFLLIVLVLLVAVPASARDVRFRKIVVDKTFRAEGVAVGDVNHDGKIDVLAGDVLPIARVAHIGVARRQGVELDGPLHLAPVCQEGGHQ